MGEWTVGRVAAVADNPRTPAVNLPDARVWLAAMLPRPATHGPAMDLILGKPPWEVNVAVVVTPTVAPTAADYDAIERDLSAIVAGRLST